MNVLEKVGEILTYCGYADDVNEDCIAIAHPCGKFGEDVEWEFREVEFDRDTLEGRRQADAIEDWILHNQAGVWVMSDRKVKMADLSAHQWRL